MIGDASMPENREKERVKKLLRIIQNHAKGELKEDTPQFGRFLLKVLADDRARQFVNKLIEKA